MNKKEIKRIAVILAGLGIAAIFLFFVNSSGTGFVALAEENSEEKNFFESEEKLSNSLSFQVVKKTELKTELVQGILQNCPQYSNLVFNVQNIGKNLAERLFVEYPSNLKVKNCLNCSVKEIKPKQIVKITLNACKSNDSKIGVNFSSINTEKNTIKIEK